MCLSGRSVEYDSASRASMTALYIGSTSTTKDSRWSVVNLTGVADRAYVVEFHNFYGAWQRDYIIEQVAVNGSASFTLVIATIGFVVYHRQSVIHCSL